MLASPIYKGDIQKSDELDRFALKIQLGETLDDEDVVIDAKYVDVTEDEDVGDPEALDEAAGSIPEEVMA